MKTMNHQQFAAAAGDLGGVLARLCERHPGASASGQRAETLGRHGRLGAMAAGRQGGRAIQRW